MGGFDFFGFFAVIFLLAGSVVLYARLRNAASMCLLLGFGASIVWAWLDARIPYWNLGPSPIPEPLLDFLSRSAFVIPGILNFAMCLSFLATALSVAKRPREPGSGV